MSLSPIDDYMPVELNETVWWKTKKGEWKSGRVVKISEKIVKHYYTGEEREIRNISVRYEVKKFTSSYWTTLGGLKNFYRKKPIQINEEKIFKN